MQVHCLQVGLTESKIILSPQKHRDGTGPHNLLCPHGVPLLCPADPGLQAAAETPKLQQGWLRAARESLRRGKHRQHHHPAKQLLQAFRELLSGVGFVALNNHSLS